MIQVIFKNMKSSKVAGQMVRERLDAIIDKFRDLRRSRIRVTLEMENSPGQPGLDHFDVKVQVQGGRFNGLRMEKGGPQLYAVLAEVVDHLLERLNRAGDRVRVKERTIARRFRLRALASG